MVTRRSQSLEPVKSLEVGGDHGRRLDKLEGLLEHWAPMHERLLLVYVRLR